MTRQKNGVWKLTDKEMLYFEIYAWKAEEAYRLLGQNAIAETARTTAKTIHSILKESGYFDRIKLGD